MRRRVKKHHLIAAVFLCFGLRGERGRIVAAALGRTGATWRRARIVFRGPDRDALASALEIRSCG